MELYEQAVDKAHTCAMVNFRLLLEKGVVGVGKYVKGAMHLFQPMVYNRDTYTLLELEFLLEYGGTDVEKDRR